MNKLLSTTPCALYPGKSLGNYRRNYRRNYNVNYRANYRHLGKYLLVLWLGFSHWALATESGEGAAATPAPPQVLSTIHPLTLIAAAITDGISEPDTLLPVNASPHNYNLKVSDLRKLLAADLVFWLGPEMERFLEKRLTTLEATRVALLMDSDGGGDPGQMPDGAEDHPQKDHHHQHPEGMDPHIWMDPANAARIARMMTASLQQQDPDRSLQYADNLDRFLASVQRLDDTNQILLAPYQDQPFFTWHDAYGHLVSHYGLNQAGVATSHPERLPGTREIGSLHTRLANAAPTCLFIEPQFPARRVEQLSSAAEGIHIAILDPMGTTIEIGPDAYPAYLEQLVGSIVDCLDKALSINSPADSPANPPVPAS